MVFLANGMGGQGALKKPMLGFVNPTTTKNMQIDVLEPGKTMKMYTLSFLVYAKGLKYN